MTSYVRYMALLLMAIFSGCLEEAEVTPPDAEEEWINFTTSDGLAGNRINVIISDSKGNLWIGTDGGVSMYDGTTFTNYSESNGLSDNFVSDIVEFEEDVMVFGTDRGLTIRDHGSWGYVTYLNNTEFSVTSMEVDAAGFGWFGTDVFGLLITDGNNNFWQEWDSQCSDCNYINTIYKGNDQKMYFGTGGGVRVLDGTSFNLNGNSFSHLGTSDGLTDNYIQSIFQDSYGTLWVGTYDGLCTQTDNQNFHEKGMYNSAPQNWTYTINQDKDGVLWFSSIGNGLVFFDGAVTRTLPESLNDKRISTISSHKDALGNLWLGTFEGGLWKYTPNRR